MCCPNEKTAVQAQMFANRLHKKFRHLKKWAQRTNTGAFRLYDRDIPEVPLVLDFYGDTANLRDAALAGALYSRPYEKDEADENEWLSAMKESAAAALGIDADRIFLKQRRRQRGASQYEKINDKCFTKIVSEGGLSFKVNLSDYLDTGLFPDRRLMRAMLRSAASGKKILNLFSYTGSFSVYAASGGASSTDSVDLSNTYLRWARENFSLNGFSAGLFRQRDFFDRSAVHAVNKLIHADALDFLEKASSAKMLWDIIILDPPAFSNSKKMTGSFDLNRDITGLLNQCLPLLAPNGKIFLSLNMRHTVFSPESLQFGLAVNKNELKVTDLGNKITDEDFRGKKTPASFLIEV